MKPRSTKDTRVGPNFVVSQGGTTTVRGLSCSPKIHEEVNVA